MPSIIWEGYSYILGIIFCKSCAGTVVGIKMAASITLKSLLKSSFGDQLEAALQDYIETSLMLNFKWSLNVHLSNSTHSTCALEPSRRMRVYKRGVAGPTIRPIWHPELKKQRKPES